MKLQVQANLGELSKWVKDIAEKQLPFITAKSLTMLASQVQSAHIQALARTFTLRNKYVIRSFRIKMAKKTEWPNCASEEGSTAEFMAMQTLGGSKKDRGGLALGVPIGARPNKQSIIPKPLWLRQLLMKRGYVHITSTSSGREMILKQSRSGKFKRSTHVKHKRIRPRRPHKGKRGWTRETIYILKPNVHIPARFPFQSIAQAVVQSKIDATFRKNFEDAIE